LCPDEPEYLVNRYAELNSQPRRQAAALVDGALGVELRCDIGAADDVRGHAGGVQRFL
jgi:hypothetical protein